MKEEFHYSFGHLIAVLIGTIVSVVWLEYTGTEISIIVILFIGMPPVLMAWAVVSKVSIDGDCIEIRYAIPFRRNKKYKHAEVEYYGAWGNKEKNIKPFAGALKSIHDPKPVVIWGFGVKNFGKLSMILGSIYPKYKDPQPVTGSGVDN